MSLPKKKIGIFAFFLLTVFTITLKTYFSYYVDFSLGVKGLVQNLILIMNPYSLIALVLSVFLFFKGKKAFWFIFIGGFLLTFLLYANVVYFRFFSDFLTFSTLNQAGNVESMGGAVSASFKWYDFVYFIDTIIYLAILIFKRKWLDNRAFSKKFVPVVMATSVALFFLNLAFAETDRPELLTRTFDHKYLVKYLGPYNFTVYDGVKTIENNQQKALASEDDLTKVLNYTKQKRTEPNPEYYGAAKKKNIIKIHLESFQTFLINKKVNGKEVTPFLNKLSSGNQDFTYFPNFFHQTGQGKTSDSEFTMDNSLYGLPQGSAYSLKGDNTYQSLPAILDQKQGYTSNVMHGDYKTFWNRDQVYKHFGIDNFYDATYYDMSDDNIVNLGLKDKPFFKASADYQSKMKKPFYSHLITLTNHYPFTLDEEDASIDKPNTGDSTVDGYIQTAHYLDQALEEYITDLKKKGLYDNSVIMIYGDHYGISENHNNAMEKLLGEKITPAKFTDLNRTGFWLKVPGKSGGVNKEYAGQMDVMPTLLHLVGIDSKNYLMFGSDMFSKQHNNVVPFRNGDFITEDYKYVNGKIYSNKDNELLTEKPKDFDKNKKQVEKDLEMSDSVLNGDLFRFYKNPDFKKVNPGKYEYKSGPKGNEKK
ncbi:polyglycerol-phosphate lipoteichoic acid synthase LtaS [Staphylococcus epidermidis]|jgi:lipoteichoic acid synthase|uniref:Lipoteichoic acid synthase n=1 Tax=Staphylococcus epidermidis (strain ATCC 12228 / FDA PCI 1200) TaxID=176280 RepID=LTAS_STAES|nr:polyglycerol-phosphate lipoteichoic acid synthase LtaS [Staphylococcus epidermidis]Q8CQ10.1 RecName: Full=Lipoteichoic acid synthase; Contains: RecName: Full=Glycerol phosphate lipoteichoic acid synthase; Short=LTA synthase; AltName: Full=Polyglycerol phosphate synthase; Contains: RecName: Full=Processed glycerol phosphate lipoteichoic acid synthase [Staphylococcus epidermidis ATCC 12228]EHQ79701.1 glycerol phosphate lipoteichoic acid synthase [Staphylococcus epidermidis VCU057]AAO04091.1 ani